MSIQENIEAIRARMAQAAEAAGRDGGEILLVGASKMNDAAACRAAIAAGIDALDTVFSDVNDEEGFLREVRLIRQLGFDGKSVINPRQIQPLHRALMPSEKDLKKAYAVMEAYEDAVRRGSGVVSLNGKMIDKPVVVRAQRLIALAETDSRIEEE